MHFLSDPRLNAIPGAAVNERVLVQLRRSGQCLIWEFRIDVIEKRKWIRPGRLSDRRPDSGFFDVGRRLVVTGEKAHSVVGSDGLDEKVREERLDGGVWRNGEVCGVAFRTFNAQVRYSGC